MTLIPASDTREVSGISDSDKARIKAYVQGAVYCLIMNLKDEVGRSKYFGARDFAGGENQEWFGTPLYALYEKHLNQGKSSREAYDGAGIDLGWILKSVLTDDKRTFEVGPPAGANTYRWVGGEP